MGKQLKQKEPLNAFAIVMWVLGVLSLFPFIMMVVISFRASGDAYKPIFAPVSMTLKNYKTVLDLLKKSLIENLRSYDAKDDRMSNSPNQMNIQSMYSDIDLDANDTEIELQAAFEEILWFVNTYLASKGQAVDAAENVEVIFNRDVLINETEAISNCAASVGIISDDTIVSMHPWVKDPAAELKKLEKQKEEADPYRAAFEMARNNQNADDGTPTIDEE